MEARTSSQIGYSDIVEFVWQMNAKIMIAIHTFEPGKFAEFSPNSRLLGGR